MNLSDPELEQRALQIIWEEVEAFGAERGAEIWERSQLRRGDFTSAMAQRVAGRIETALAKGLVPIVESDEEREFLRVHEIQSVALLDALAFKIRDLATRRSVIQASRALSQAALDPELETLDVLTRLEQAMDSIPNRGDRWRYLSETFGRVLKFLEEKQDGKRIPCVRSGFDQLDAGTGGLAPTLVVIAAMPGVGKSAFVGSILRNMAARDEMPAVFCMEDRSEWLAFRFLAHDSGVGQFITRNRQLYPEQWRDIGDAWAKVTALGSKILCDDREALNPAEVLFSARAAIQRGARAIFLDNMTAMRFARGQRMDLDMQDFLVSARAIADKHQVPFVVLSHVRRREGLDASKMPSLTDCTETSAYEKVCRLAYGLCRDPKTNELEVGVLKNTNGQSHTRYHLQLRPSSALVEAEIETATQQGLGL